MSDTKLLPMTTGGGGNGEVEEDAPLWLLPTMWRKALAEWFGTAFLVIVGCGALSSNGGSGGTLIPMWAFGGVVQSLIQSLSGISGCHVNPQVTLAAVAVGTLSFTEGAAYVVAQMLGAVCGGGFLWLILPDVPHGSPLSGRAGCTMLAPGMHPWQGMLTEAAGTALLVTVVLVADMHKPWAARNNSSLSGPLGVLTALISIIAFCGPLTGAGLNYARVFGPALVFGGECFKSNHWLWPVGETLGSLLAVLFALVIVPGLWRKVAATFKLASPVPPSAGGRSHVNYGT